MSGTDFYYTPQIVLAEKAGRACQFDRRDQGLLWKLRRGGYRGGIQTRPLSYEARTDDFFFRGFSWQDHGGSFPDGQQGLSEEILPSVRTGYYPCALPELLSVPHGVCYPTCGSACVRWIEDPLFRTSIPPEEVAAIFVEPIQGEGGISYRRLNFTWN